MDSLSHETLVNLYNWLDSLPLSKTKRNLARDFSDGCLTAEIVAHFFPDMIDMHNYSPSNSVRNKMDNWKTLNKKVFDKMKFQVSEDTVREIVNSNLRVVEYFLHKLRCQIEFHMQRQSKKSIVLKKQTSSHQPKGIIVKKPSSTKVKSKLPKTKIPEELLKKSIFEVNQGNISEETLIPDLSSISSLDNVPLAIYEQKNQENLMKDETIKLLEARNRRLQYLVNVKDKRITELIALLEEINMNQNSDI